MAELNFALPTNITEYPNSFKRQGAFPLERYSVFYAIEADAEKGIAAQTALEAAKDYAKNNPIAYVGQILTVVTVAEDDSVASVKVYKIDNEAGDLSPVGDEAGLTAATEAVAALAERMTTAEGDINTIKGALNGEEGLIKKVEALGVAVEGAQETADKAQEDATRALGFESRINVLESAGYATTSEVATAKSEAIAAAKTETENQISAVVSQYLTGDGAADAIDTLNEIAQWIADDEAGASKIIKDVKAIQDDYLKGSDKTELNGTITSLDERLSKEIDDLEAFVGSLPEGATSQTVVAYIGEVIEALKIGDYAKAKDLSDLADRVTALDKADGRIASIETDVSANTAEISDLKKVVGTIETGNNIADMLKNKVEKEDGSRLINATEIAILSKLNLNDGQVEIGGTVAAGSVTGLPQRIADILASTADGEGKLLEGKVVGRHIAESSILDTHLSADLVSKITNSVKQIKVGNADAVDANGTLAFSDEFKMEDSTVAINSVNVNKLVQTDGEWLILNGGDSTEV